MIELLARRRVEQEKNAVIAFEDSAVKNICVNNWGGNVVPGEITPAEAAAVTSLNDKFKNNTSIQKFNELQYFTSLTSLNSTNTSGQFSGSINLKEVTLPQAAISNLLCAFYTNKSALGSLDLSPLTASNLNIRNLCRGCSSLKQITLKGTTYTNNWYYSFDGCTSLTKIVIDGTANLNSVANFDHSFNGCTKLSTITGTITNIAQSIDFHSCPLTLDSILVVLNGLKSGVTGKTLTLKNTTSNYTNPIKENAQYESIATDKGWTIAYS